MRDLEGEEWHHDGHPAHSHSDVCATLLCDDVHGAEEEHGPDDIVEHHQTEERHEDPQWHTRIDWIFS